MKKAFKILLSFTVLFAISLQTTARDLVWFDGAHAISCKIQRNVDPVVKVALQMFAGDMKAVTGKSAVESKNGVIRVMEIDKASNGEDSCGIAIGSSHCEPLLRNNVDEWDVNKRGRFNYITNKKSVQDYWIERLKEVKDSKGGNMFTIGMRGIHDGSPSKQMQVFIPYKEVLQIYEKGLKVPDYVTLMWCDDNYGYMTRLSNAEEQKQKGVGGVYYHLSYWGRPHDYLWLTTTQPGLIYNEMRAAYDHNVRKLWIVNVHDPKVAGYDLELFFDMAWNIDCVNGNTIEKHYKAWLCRQFGKEAGERLFPQMKEFYRLCGERRPEFMGWSQTELDRYLKRYDAVAANIKDVEKNIPQGLRDAYFAAIEYPVLAADAHARKILWAQKARSYANGSTEKDMFANNSKLYHATAESQEA